MRNLLFYIFIITVFIGCTDNQKEQDLLQREENLSAREKEFDAKEAEYKNLLSLRDSLQNIVPEITVKQELPAELQGKWSGKMICTESSCTDHVIGDQRTDTWEFSANVVKMTTKTGTERLFMAMIEGGDLKLISEDPANITTSSEITLNLTDLQIGRMKGTRNLNGKDNCIAKFSVELEKAKI